MELPLGADESERCLKVKLFVSLALVIVLFAACTITPRARQAAAGNLPPGPSQRELDEAVRYTQAELPFAVEIDPYGAVYDSPVRGGELQHLREHFLLPLAKSRYAAKIKRIRINAFALEWFQWTCVIELKDNAPISLTHFAGFYDGSSNHDPDSYVKARQFVLAALDNIGRHVGWSHE